MLRYILLLSLCCGFSLLYPHSFIHPFLLILPSSWPPPPLSSSLLFSSLLPRSLACQGLYSHLSSLISRQDWKETERSSQPLHNCQDVRESDSRSAVSDFFRPHGLYSPWTPPGQNTGVGSLSLLQGIFPMQGSNPGLPHCSQILYELSHKGSPRMFLTMVISLYLNRIFKAVVSFAVETNDHKPHGLKQHKFIFLFLETKLS